MHHTAKPANVRPLFLAAALFVFAGQMLTACVPVFPVVVGAGAAAVAASSTEKGLGTSVSDAGINTKINDLFIRENVSLFTQVDITVNNGAVLLTGKVKLPEHRIEATRIAWQVKGVTEVINELQVEDKSSLKSIAKDQAAGAQLRLKLLGDSAISSLNFSIDVVNGTVYVTGLASSEEEKQAVINHARTVRFATEVVDYIRINDDIR